MITTIKRKKSEKIICASFLIAVLLICFVLNTLNVNAASTSTVYMYNGATVSGFSSFTKWAYRYTDPLEVHATLTYSTSNTINLSTYTAGEYGGFAELVFSDPIDLTYVSSISAHLSSGYNPVSSTGVQWGHTSFAIFGTGASDYNLELAGEVYSTTNGSISNLTYTIDTSNLTGDYYIGFVGYSVYSETVGAATSLFDKVYFTCTNPTISSVTLSPSSAYTSGNVTATVSASNYSGTLYYSDDGGSTWQTSNAFSISSNGTYTFEVKNEFGVTSSTVSKTISNIDKTAPTINSITQTY